MHRPLILYGVQGEGRGHATRSVSLIKALHAKGYELRVFTGGDALPLFRKQAIPVFEIPVFRYQYSVRGSLSLAKTFWANFRTAAGLFLGNGRQFLRVLRAVKRARPTLIISDFEPYLCRISRALGIPLFSINHQHFLTESELPILKGVHKRLAVQLFQLSTRILTGKPDTIIASSFHHFPRRSDSRALFVGPFIHEKLKCMPVHEDGHITVYLKKPLYINKLLPVLEEVSETRFQVFANWEELPARPRVKSHIRLRNIHQDRFLESLASSSGLLTTAGNQVLGEAIYLRKPVLAFPEPNVVEQELNALALERSNCGRHVELDQLNAAALRRFLKQRAEFLDQPHWVEMLKDYDGSETTLRTVLAYLESQEKAVA